MRERWFGATGRRVPAIALRGLGRRRGRARRRRRSTTSMRSARRTPTGTPVVVRAGDAAAVARALARPEVRVRRSSPTRRCSSSTCPSSRMADDRRHLLDLRLRPRRPGSGASRHSRSSSPSARSCRGPAPHVGAIATQSYANPRYGPDGLALLREGLSAEEVVERLTAADERPRAAPARRRRRRGSRSDVHRRRMPRLGGRPDGRRATPRRETSSSPAPPSTRSPRRSRRPAGRPLAGAAARLPRRGGGGGRRQPRPPVGGAARRRARRRLREPLGHARRPSRRRPRRPARRAAPDPPAPRRALRHDAARGLDTGRRRASGRARRAPRARRATEPRRVGGGREPRGARRGRGRDRPGRARATTGGDMSERYGVASLDELATPAIPGQARWHTIRRTLGVSAFGVNAWTATEDGGQIIGEHDEASGEAPRGAVHRAHRPRDVHARRRGGRPPRRARSCTFPTRR